MKLIGQGCTICSKREKYAATIIFHDDNIIKCQRDIARLEHDDGINQIYSFQRDMLGSIYQFKLINNVWIEFPNVNGFICVVGIREEEYNPYI